MEKTHWKEHWMGLQSTSPRGVNTKVLTNVSPGTCLLIFQRQEIGMGKHFTKCSLQNMSPKGLHEKKGTRVKQIWEVVTMKLRL